MRLNHPGSGGKRTEITATRDDKGSMNHLVNQENDVERDVKTQLENTWRRIKPAVRSAVIHRERGSEIAEKAVMTGAVVAVGIGTMLAFMNGLGTFFTTLISKITAMVP